MAVFEPTYVTELNQAECLLSTDYVLISQKLSSDTETLSRKITAYDFAQNMAKLGNFAYSDDLGQLSAKVLQNQTDINNMKQTIDQLVSCVIKMANCIQENKKNIAEISSHIN